MFSDGRQWFGYGLSNKTDLLNYMISSRKEIFVTDSSYIYYLIHSGVIGFFLIIAILVCIWKILIEKPCKGTFNVRIGPELHLQAVLRARQNNESLNSFVKEAIIEKLTSSHWWFNEEFLIYLWIMDRMWIIYSFCLWFTTTEFIYACIKIHLFIS